MTPPSVTTMRGGPWDLRADSIASGTSSRPITMPMLAAGQPALGDASSVPYQSTGCGPPPNWIVTPLCVGRRDRHRVAAVPAAGSEHSSQEFARLDDAREQSRRAYAFEDGA